MSAYFSERANAFIDDHIVTPLLAKEYDEAAKISKNYKYDPESNLTTTTLETSLQSDHEDPSYPDSYGYHIKNFDEGAKPRSCCQLLNSAFMIILAVGNATAWILSFVFSPFGVSWNSIVVYVTGAICLVTTLMTIMNERKILSYPTSEYDTYTHHLGVTIRYSALLCSSNLLALPFCTSLEQKHYRLIRDG